MVAFLYPVQKRSLCFRLDARRERAADIRCKASLKV